MNIFFVYGSWYIGATISYFLSKVQNGHIIGQSRQIKTAIRMMSEKTPDIVIIDVELMDGMWEELLQWLKGISRVPLVIIIGPSSIPHYRTTCLKKGADFFFELPSEIERLQKTINEFINHPFDREKVKTL
jgi:two-component system LytT family response regulator